MPCRPSQSCPEFWSAKDHCCNEAAAAVVVTGKRILEHSEVNIAIGADSWSGRTTVEEGRVQSRGGIFQTHAIYKRERRTIQDQEISVALVVHDDIKEGCRLRRAREQH